MFYVGSNKPGGSRSQFPSVKGRAMKPGLANRLNSVKTPVAIVAAVYLLFIASRLGFHGWNPSFFVTAGDGVTDPQQVPENFHVLTDSAGYDGQYFYRLALDPFPSDPTGHGVTLDAPAYRHQRILYPLIVRTLAFGKPALVPTTMIVVNYLALCIMAVIGTLFARSMKQHTLWGLVFPLYPGFLLSLARDLSEIVSLCFLLAMLLLVRLRRHALATACLVLAILAKEPALIAAGAAAVVWLADKRRDTDDSSPKWYMAVVPIAVYAAWQLVLYLHWGTFTWFQGSGDFGIPMVGFTRFFLDTLAFDTLLRIRSFIELCFIIPFTLCVVWSLRASTATRYEKICWMLYAVLMALMTGTVWLEDWGFLRVMSEFYVLGAAILIGTNYAIKLPIFAVATIWWLLLSVIRTIR